MAKSIYPLTLDIPILETDELILRGHTLDDFEDCCATWSDPEVVRYLGGKRFTRDESWARFLRYPGHWAMFGYGLWVVEERSSGRFAGEVGFLSWHREFDCSLDRTPEGAWVLARWAHGKGWGTQAVRVAHRWGDENLPGERYVCLIGDVNHASIRVAEKCGYRELKRSVYQDAPVIIMERSRSAAGR